MIAREASINGLLVELFNKILKIEQNAIKNGALRDLSVTEIHTIDAIGMYKQRTMSEVAFDLAITIGTLTTGVNKLIKKGYVKRSRIESDRRVVLISLTKKGKLAYRLHEKFHKDLVKRTIDRLSNKEEELIEISLKKISDFLGYKYGI